MATIPKVLTYEEWLRMPSPQCGIEEVVDGEISIMPPPPITHARIIHRLSFLLARQIDENLFTLLESAFGVVIQKDPLTCRQPDLALCRNESMVIKDGLLHSPPDLIVEVLSPSETRHRKEEKLRDYASIGVPEVWLLSPDFEAVEVRRLKEGRYHREGIFVEGTLTPVRFPEIKVDITSIWPLELPTPQSNAAE